MPEFRPNDIDQRDRPAMHQPLSSANAGPLARQTRDGLQQVGDAPPTERRILAVMGEVKRVRRWVVPRLLRVRAFLGEVRVDLRESTIPDGFTMDVRAVGARVTLVVPPGIDVEFGVTALLGNAISQAPEPTATSSAKRIHVLGSASLGEVRVLVRDAVSE